jgi:glucuronoarabinoxylan endo-1,4-beta-xylanase
MQATMKRLSKLLPVSLFALVLLQGCAISKGTGAVSAPLTPTVTTLTASPNPASAGAKVTLAATVGAATGIVVDNVTFYDGTTALGSATLSAGVATLAVNTFAANSTHAITATYEGDALNATSTSQPVTVTVGGTTAPASINVHATFTFTSPNQTIAGFGAAEAFDLTYLDSHPYKAEMYKALFDPTAGLGLTFLRVQNLYRPGVTNFDVDTPSIVTSANAAHGTPLTILMSSWSPPTSLKSNGTTNGCTTTTNGVCTGGIGTLVQVSGAYDYADFAQYWYDSLNAYSALGVTPGFISIQNEPDFSATYAGCRFNPTEATYNGTNYAGYGLAFNAVYQRIQGLSSIPKMVGPETESAGQSFLDMAAQIPSNEVGAYAHHLYNVNSGSAVSNGTTTTITSGASPDTGLSALSKVASTYPTAMKFMTEYYDTPGFYNAWSINDALTVANDNAYIFWQAVWPSTLTTAKDQSADQEGLLYADNPSTPSTWVFNHGWTYNDAYYALKHYSYFVRPGYVRYAATVDNTDERASVFQSPDGKTTVIVILNTSTSNTDGLSLNLSDISYTNSTVYRSTFSQPISGERFALLGSYLPTSGTASSNNSGGISLPPQSVVTIVLTN